MKKKAKKARTSKSSGGNKKRGVKPEEAPIVGKILLSFSAQQMRVGSKASTTVVAFVFPVIRCVYATLRHVFFRCIIRGPKEGFLDISIL